MNHKSSLHHRIIKQLAYASCFIVISALTIRAEIIQKTMPMTLTLDETIRIALENNLDIEIAEKELQIIQSQYRQAVGAAIPDIILAGNYTRNIKKPSFFLGGRTVEVGESNSMNGTASIEQIIYSGGRVKTGMDIAKTLIHSQKENIRSVKNNISFAAKRLFYAVLLAESMVSIQKENLDLTQGHLETIRQRYRQGLDSDLTVRRQEVEAANAKTNYIQAKNAFELAKLSLQDILSLDLENSITVIGKFHPPKNELPDYSIILRTALKTRPELIAVRKKTEVSRLMIKIAAGEQKPQIAAFLNTQWLWQSHDLSYSDEEKAESVFAGINLRYSLFTGGELREQLNQVRTRYDNAQAAENKMNRAVKLEVRNHWLAVGESKERIEAQEKAIDQARLSLTATEKRYRAGEASQLELNDITFALNRSRTLYVQALHDYWVSLAALERAVGESLEAIKP